MGGPDETAAAGRQRGRRPDGRWVVHLRSALLVAAFDFLESLRSRKAIALLVLYVAGSAGATGIFISLLNKVQANLPVAPEELLKMASGLIGNPDVAKEILTIPIVALFYGWVALTFVPLLVVLTSANAIAGEVATGSARFALFRCHRLAWIGGKAIGQTALMLFGILAGGLASFFIASAFAWGYPPAAGAYWTVLLSVRAASYGAPYLALTLACSQMTRSASWSRALSLLAAALVAIGGNVLQSSSVERLAPVVVDGLRLLVPRTYWLDLWRPQLGPRAMAMLALVGLSLLYFAVGYLVFRRRDG
jgi:ABC-type transport system involved in multi-copper enzyme maturation permease subunit